MLKGFCTPGGNRTHTPKNWVLNPAYLMVNLAKYTYNQLINKYLILIDFI